MKAKVIILMVVCVGLLGGCKGYCRKSSKVEIQKPANIKPIDTENYNDVYTVYWNYFDNAYPDTHRDTVLMCGYVIVYGTDYSGNLLWYPMLTDDSIKAIDYTDMKICTVEFSWNDSISNQVKSNINTSIPNKCYIKGIVESRFVQMSKCEYQMHNIPILRITNVEDIYFKK